MKTLVSMIAAAVLIIFGNGLQSVAAENSADIRSKLEAMGVADQAVRAKAAPLLAAGKLQSAEMKTVAQEMSAVDGHNLVELRKIIERYGWPDSHIVGVDASNAAFLILQHSPQEAQKALLPVFREAALAAKARGSDLAMLEDRILTHDGKKQRYGTQIFAGPDGMPRVSPVEDPQNLDERRKTVGLPTMKQYLDRAEQDFGRPIDRSALAVQAE